MHFILFEHLHRFSSAPPMAMHCSANQLTQPTAVCPLHQGLCTKCCVLDARAFTLLCNSHANAGPHVDACRNRNRMSHARQTKRRQTTPRLHHQHNTQALNNQAQETKMRQRQMTPSLHRWHLHAGPHSLTPSRCRQAAVATAAAPLTLPCRDAALLLFLEAALAVPLRLQT